MATDLSKSPKLQRFIPLLAALNKQSAEMLQTGNMTELPKMNEVVEEMCSLQQGSREDAFRAIEEDMQIIRKNFNAIVMMLQSNEENKVDEATSVAVKKFLRNVFDATVRIVYAYGLA